MSGSIVLAVVATFVAAAMVAGLAAGMALAPARTARQRLRAMTADARISGASLLRDSAGEQPRTRTRVIHIAVMMMLVPIAWAVLGWPALIFGVIAGYFAPELWLSRQAAKRRHLIERGLPDALDLIVVCLEAGSGLDLAMARTGEEMASAHPALASELRLVTAETRAGSRRIDALRKLAKRTGAHDIQTIVGLLTQTERFGTSVAHALRTHAAALRVARRQRAEARAATASVKLVFPLVLFLFPAVYVVVLGPAVVQFMRVFVEHIAPR